MSDLRKHSSTSNLIRFTLKNASAGVGLTGLSNASSGLIISTICDNEAAATVYTVAASNVETITTLGTYAAPTANKCRFKEVDSVNHKGLYEFQFADARFSVASAKRLVISVTGATSLLDADYEIQLVQFDPYDSVRVGLTSLPNAAAEAAGGLYTRGTGAGQINQLSNGVINANTTQVAGTPQTAGDLAAMITDVDDYVDTEIANIQNRLPAVLVGGRMDSSVGSNLDKTGYSLTQVFPTNFASLSITAAGLVDIAQTAADKVWSSTTRTLTALSSALALSVWDVLESAIATANSIGLKVKTNLDAAISSRLSSASYTAPDNAGISSILTESQSHPTLTEIEASAVLAKEATVSTVKAKTDTIIWQNVTDIKDESLGKFSINKVTNVLTLYRLDGVTVLKQFNLTNDASVSERVPV